jgi:hypothetical protein
LINILYDTFENSLGGTNSYIKRYTGYIKVSLKVVYFGYMLLKNGVTQGQMIYNVRMINLTTGKAILYLLTKIILPNLLQFVDDYIVKYKQPDDLIVRMFKLINTILKGLELYNFLRFITYGDYPSIWNRLLELKYVFI